MTDIAVIKERLEDCGVICITELDLGIASEFSEYRGTYWYNHNGSYIVSNTVPTENEVYRNLYEKIKTIVWNRMDSKCTSPPNLPVGNLNFLLKK